MKMSRHLNGPHGHERTSDNADNGVGNVCSHAAAVEHEYVDEDGDAGEGDRNHKSTEGGFKLGAIGYQVEGNA